MPAHFSYLNTGTSFKEVTGAVKEDILVIVLPGHEGHGWRIDAGKAHDLDVIARRPARGLEIGVENCGRGQQTALHGNHVGG